MYFPLELISVNILASASRCQVKYEGAEEINECALEGERRADFIQVGVTIEMIAFKGIKDSLELDSLAKETTKQTPKKSQTSLAYLGTMIKLLQRASQAEEWRKYRKTAREKKTSYRAISNLKLKN